MYWTYCLHRKTLVPLLLKSYPTKSRAVRNLYEDLREYMSAEEEGARVELVESKEEIQKDGLYMTVSKKHEHRVHVLRRTTTTLPGWVYNGTESQIMKEYLFSVIEVPNTPGNGLLDQIRAQPNLLRKAKEEREEKEVQKRRESRKTLRPKNEMPYMKELDARLAQRRVTLEPEEEREEKQGTSSAEEEFVHIPKPLPLPQYMEI